MHLLIALSDCRPFLVKAYRRSIFGLNVNLYSSSVHLVGERHGIYSYPSYWKRYSMHVVVLNAERFSYCVVSRPPSREHLRLFLVITNWTWNFWKHTINLVATLPSGVESLHCWPPDDSRILRNTRPSRRLWSTSHGHLQLRMLACWFNWLHAVVTARLFVSLRSQLV